MKRLLFTIFILMAVASSTSAEILATVASAMYRARADLNVDTTDTEYLPTIEATHRIREAVSLINHLLMDNRTNTAIPLAVNTYKYGLDSLETITSVQFIRGDTIKTLSYVPRAQWYEMENQFSKGLNGMLAHPSYWDYYDDTIYIFPVPSRVDTLYATANDEIFGLDTLTLLSGIDEVYRPAIIKYVVYETAKIRQHPMTAIYKQDYERLWGLLFPNFNPQVSNVQ